MGPYSDKLSVLSGESASSPWRDASPDSLRINPIAKRLWRLNGSVMVMLKCQ
jgi:hypothetical protein